MFLPAYLWLRSIAVAVILSSFLTPGPKTPNHFSAALQSATNHAMAGQSGSVVVLEVDSGKLLAHHRMDVASRRLAAPGSAVKPFTLLALLNTGRFNPQRRLLCRRQLNIAGKKMNCSHPQISSAFDAVEALAYSCNSYFASVANQLTESGLRKQFQRAGLLSATGLAAGEVVGHMQRPGNDEQLKLLALGEEGIEITPLELLIAYRGLATRQENANDDTWKTVAQGLRGSTAYGMAHAAQPDGLEVAGKTGTAGSASSPGTHGWFAGYAPADHPEIVLVVYLEHGRGLDAAAVARKIFMAYRQARGAR